MKSIDIAIEELHNRKELWEIFINKIEELKKKHKNLKQVCLHYKLPYESIRHIIKWLRTPTIQKLNEFNNKIK
jgi:hypothetical protein